MAGRKAKMKSEKSLARSHEAGTEVLFTQPCIHPRYGAIMFAILDHVDFYFKAAESNLEDAKKFHASILSTPVGNSNNRLISDGQLLGNFFMHAQSVVLFSYMALEYFSMNCIKSLGRYDEWKTSRLDEKLKLLIPTALGIPKLPNKLRDAFGDLETRRHSLNHPSPENVANGNDREWDTVHMAWLMIGNYEKSYKDALAIYHHLLEPMRKWNKDHSSGPVTLTGVKRGIRFDNPAKKNFDGGVGATSPKQE